MRMFQELNEDRAHYLKHNRKSLFEEIIDYAMCNVIYRLNKIQTLLLELDYELGYENNYSDF